MRLLFTEELIHERKEEGTEIKTQRKSELQIGGGGGGQVKLLCYVLD